MKPARTRASAIRRVRDLLHARGIAFIKIAPRVGWDQVITEYDGVDAIGVQKRDKRHTELINLLVACSLGDPVPTRVDRPKPEKEDAR